MLSCVTISMIRRPGMMLGWTLWLNLCLCAGFLQAVPDTPLVAEGTTVEIAGSRAWQWGIGAADDALGAGFSALAARLYRQALVEPSLEPGRRAAIQLSLVSALIGDAKYSDAANVLESYTYPKEGSYLLLRAITGYQNGNLDAAEEDLEAIDVERMTAWERSWYYLTAGLLKETRGESDAAKRLYADAGKNAVSETQQAQIETALRRNQLLSGQVNESIAAGLKAKVRELQGQRGGFEMARLLAIVLDQLGRKDEAIEVIEEQLRFVSVQERDLRDQFLLLLGLILGEESGRGRLALQELLNKDGSRDLQKIAFYLLARGPLAGKGAEEFPAMLDELINRASPHQLLDEFYYFRAVLALNADGLDTAESYAKRLLDQFPGSPLKNSAIRLLAFVAWKREPPQYRTAADYLNRMRASLPDGPDKARLGILMADCFFLNGDFVNAAGAYEAAMGEASNGQDRGALLFQLVLSELRSDRLDRAKAHLDEAGDLSGIDPLQRWQAEWNVVSDMKTRGQTDEAFARIRNLLEGAEQTAMPPDLRLRLMWLESQLSVEARQAADTPARCDLILNILAEAPERIIDDEQRSLIASHTLLLKGQALLINQKAEDGLQVFVQLRERFGSSSPAVLSYLIEARYFVRVNRPVEAQRRLIAVADLYRESEYAPLALWEAALNSEVRGLNASYQEAVALLERLTRDYPEHYLVFYARLKQGDLSRQLNLFGTAQFIYEDIINKFPDHPERYRAEISRADCFLAQASQNEAFLEDAIAILSRLFDLGNLPADLRAEAGFKRGFAANRQKDEVRAQEFYWLVIARFLIEQEAVGQMRAQGRYWLSRCIFELGSLFERENRYEDAREIYHMVSAHGLPGRTLAEVKIRNFSSRPAGL